MPQMLIWVVNDDDKLEKILEEFIEIGIRGATIIDSVGMGRFLTHNTPFFSSLHSMINNKSETNKTVFVVSKHECKIKQAIELIRKAVDDFKDPDSGILFVLPVLESYGFAKPLDDEGCH